MFNGVSVLKGVSISGGFLLKKETGNQLLEHVEAIVNNLGFSVVEISSGTIRNRLKISMIIYSPEGVRVEDCTTVHKAVFSRLEILYDAFDVYLEVSSPGIERSFKDAREFVIFQGKPVKIMYGESSDWEPGIIDTADNREVIILFGEVARKIPYSDIHKCKLDYLREVRKS